MITPTKEKYFKLKETLEKFEKLENRFNDFVIFKNKLINESLNPVGFLNVTDQRKLVARISFSKHPKFMENLKNFLIKEQERIEKELSDKLLELSLFE